MVILVTGGSSSGKSSYAEDRALGLDTDMHYYLATMAAYDEESQNRIKRHRMLRAGKGWETIEQPSDIEMAGAKMVDVKKLGRSTTVLLECMSNLVANEMFGVDQLMSADTCTSKVLGGICKLRQACDHLVIVTNNIFEDGAEYDESVKEYLRALGKINQSLARMADEAYEVVVGIPVRIK